MTYLAFPDNLTMVHVTLDGSSPSDPVPEAVKQDEEEIVDKPSFCLLVKTWTIYYITLTFALLAIFRFKIFFKESFIAFVEYGKLHTFFANLILQCLALK